jgi:hypothetical protein
MTRYRQGDARPSPAPARPRPRSGPRPHPHSHPCPCALYSVSLGFGASVRPVGGLRLPARYGSGQGAPGPS